MRALQIDVPNQRRQVLQLAMARYQQGLRAAQQVDYVLQEQKQDVQNWNTKNYTRY